MNLGAKNLTVVMETRQVTEMKLSELEPAIGGPGASDAAEMVTFFGPTVAGEQRLVDILDMDLSRALLVGQSYEWARPFVRGEFVIIHVVIKDVFQKGSNTFAVVETVITSESGEMIQVQTTTFIERGSVA